MMEASDTTIQNDNNNNDNSHGGEVLEAPLLIGGSQGRGRPSKFTFWEFVAISHGPGTLPVDGRTLVGFVAILIFMYGIVFCPIVITEM